MAVPLYGTTLWDILGTRLALSFLATLWAVALTLMAARRGDWKVFLLYLGWSTLLWVGVFCFVLPGVIILALLWTRMGPRSLLLLLWPLGSAVLASSPPPSFAFPSPGYGMGPRVAPDVAILTVVALLAAIGVLSRLLALLPAAAALLAYCTLGLMLALSLVWLLGRPSVRTLVLSLLLFVTLLGVADICVRGLGSLAAVPLEAGPGVTGVAGRPAVALAVLGPSLLSALVGYALWRRGAPTPAVILAMALAVGLSVLALVAWGLVVA